MMSRALTAILAVLALSLAGCDAPPGEPAGPLTLTLFHSARAADEAVLEWTPDPRAERWQWRRKDLTSRRDFLWTEWEDVPGSNAGTTTHRVGGLLQWHQYRFQVRPWTARGPGQPSVPARSVPDADRIWGQAETADGITVASGTMLLERGGTFRLYDEDNPYTFTVPGSGLWSVNSAIDGRTGMLSSERPEGRRAEDLHGAPELTLQLLASVRYQPVYPDPPLRALSAERAGEVLLHWTSPTSAPDVLRWQYRSREAAPGWSYSRPWESEWVDIPGSDGETRSYRLGGTYGNIEFQVRPVLGVGPGDAYPAARIVLPHQHPGDLHRPRGALEPGGTFVVARFADPPIAIAVPDGMFLHLADGWQHCDPEESDCENNGLWTSAVLRDIASGSYLLLNEVTGEYIERHIRPDPDGRDVDALFDRIVESTRRVPMPARWTP